MNNCVLLLLLSVMCVMITLFWHISQLEYNKNRNITYKICALDCNGANTNETNANLEKLQCPGHKQEGIENAMPFYNILAIRTISKTEKRRHGTRVHNI